MFIPILSLSLCLSVSSFRIFVTSGTSGSAGLLRSYIRATVSPRLRLATLKRDKSHSGDNRRKECSGGTGLYPNRDTTASNDLDIYGSGETLRLPDVYIEAC